LRKFSTVLGASSSKNSIAIVPSVVFILAVLMTMTLLATEP